VNLGRSLLFPPSFQLQAVTLQGTDRPNRLIHGSVGFFDNGMAYTAPGLLASDRIHLSQRRKGVFAQELAGLIGRALR